MDTDVIIDKIIGEVNTLKKQVAHLEKLEVPISAGGGGGGYVTDHALLSNLEYSAAGHTNFQPVISWPLAASVGGTGVANGASAALTLANAALWLAGGGAASKLTLPNAAIDIQGGGAASVLKLPNAAIELAGGGASGKLTLPNAATTISGGGTLALATFTLTVAGTASIIGTNTGDVTLAAPNHGLGLTNQVITLGTPSTLTTITTNGVTTTTHAHAVKNSANPGAAASILASDANGYLTLVKLLTDTLADKSGGNLTISPAGDIMFDPAGHDVSPTNNYHINLGSPVNKYLSLWAAELNVETLIARDVISTIGGQILVAPTTELTNDMGSGVTVMTVKHNNLAVGNICRMEANALVEFIDIDGTALVAASAVQDMFQVATNLTAIYTVGVKFAIYGTPLGVNDGVWTVDHSTWSAPNTNIYVVEDVASNNYLGGNIVWRAPAAIGPYTYDITRNLEADPGGPEDWIAGDAVVDISWGFIDLYAIHGLKSGTEYGPTIVGNVRASATYNDWGPRWAIGNLNGLYGYGTDLCGAAFGRYAAGKANVTIDETNGFRLRSYTTDILQIKNTDGLGYIVGPLYLDTNGGIYQGTGTFASPTNGLKIYNSGGQGYLELWNTGAMSARLSYSGIGFAIPAVVSDPHAITWLSGATVRVGLYGYETAVHNSFEAYALAVAGKTSWCVIGAAAPSHYMAQVELYAVSDVTSASLLVVADPFGSGNYILGSRDLRLVEGLYVGSAVFDPAAGTITSKLSDAATNTAPVILSLNHSTSDTPAQYFGASLILRAEDTTTDDVNQFQIASEWVSATHASRTSLFHLYAYDTAARTVMTGKASGSAPMVAFLGAAAVVRAAHIPDPIDLATCITRLSAALVVIENLGFVATA